MKFWLEIPKKPLIKSQNWISHLLAKTLQCCDFSRCLVLWVGMRFWKVFFEKSIGLALRAHAIMADLAGMAVGGSSVIANNRICSTDKITNMYEGEINFREIQI